MAGMRIAPVGTSKAELLELIDDIRRRVAEDSSFEGSFEYLLPMPEDHPYEASVSDYDGRPMCRLCGLLGGPDDHKGDPPDADFMVQASYRVGNNMGQGSVRIVGQWQQLPEESNGKDHGGQDRAPEDPRAEQGDAQG